MLLFHLIYRRKCEEWLVQTGPPPSWVLTWVVLHSQTGEAGISRMWLREHSGVYKSLLFLSVIAVLLVNFLSISDSYPTTQVKPPFSGSLPPEVEETWMLTWLASVTAWSSYKHAFNPSTSLMDSSDIIPTGHCISTWYIQNHTQYSKCPLTTLKRIPAGVDV